MKAFKFRVLLDSNKDEEVFRDILVKSDDDFESFFKQIMKSFAFSGSEMASFYISDDEWERGFEINLMDMGAGDDSGLPNVMSQAVINDFIEQPDQKIILVYDFFKMWCFLIELQETLELDDQQTPQEVLAVGIPPKESEENNEDALLKGENMGGFDDLDDEDGFGDQFDSLDDFDDFSDDTNLY